MLDFKIDPDRCTECGECVRDCPVRIIERTDGLPFIRPEKESDCLQCQHCLAICPEAALSILGKDPEDSLSLNESFFARVLSDGTTCPRASQRAAIYG